MSPETVAILIGWANMLTGYTIPTDLHVEYVPHAFFEKIVCASPETCTKVLGAYLDNLAPNIIFIDDRVEDQANNVLVMGMVLHEIIHAGQYFSGQYDIQNCDDSLRREREAFYYQDQFLIKHGRRPPMRLTTATCRK